MVEVDFVEFERLPKSYDAMYFKVMRHFNSPQYKTEEGRRSFNIAMCRLRRKWLDEKYGVAEQTPKFAQEISHFKQKNR